MIRRFLDALQRGTAEQGPPYPPRPNALSREVVRAERLRREARQAESATRQDTHPAREERTPRGQQPVAPPPRDAAAPLATSLKSRSNLRRAMLLKEILGPPAAMRWPRNGDPDG
jgi:hypothetical protein